MKTTTLPFIIACCLIFYNIYPGFGKTIPKIETTTPKTVAALKLATDPGSIRNILPVKYALGGLKTIEINLNLLEEDDMTRAADAAMVEFSDNFCTCVNMQDAAKFTNSNETFSLLRDGTSLAIERRPLIITNDTFFLKLTRSTQRSYQLLFVANNLEAVNLVAFLEDKYTGIAIPVSLSGSTAVNFTIDADTASMNPERFRLIFRPPAVLPVTFREVNAWQQGDQVALRWTVGNQLNTRQYEIEKSTDGKSFFGIKTFHATNSGNVSDVYNWLDRTAGAGDNYYRIRNLDLDGGSAYSKVVKVNMPASAGKISVSPNPVTGGQLRLELHNMESGQYKIRLLTINGQVVLTRKITHAGGTASQKIILSTGNSSGMHKLEVTGPDNVKRTISLFISE